MVITKHGRPAAVVISLEDLEPLKEPLNSWPEADCRAWPEFRVAGARRPPFGVLPVKVTDHRAITPRNLGVGGELQGGGAGGHERRAESRPR